MCTNPQGLMIHSSPSPAPNQHKNIGSTCYCIFDTHMQAETEFISNQGPQTSPDFQWKDWMLFHLRLKTYYQMQRFNGTFSIAWAMVKFTFVKTLQIKLCEREIKTSCCLNLQLLLPLRNPSCQNKSLDIWGDTANCTCYMRRSLIEQRLSCL